MNIIIFKLNNTKYIDYNLLLKKSNIDINDILFYHFLLFLTILKVEEILTTL